MKHSEYSYKKVKTTTLHLTQDQFEGLVELVKRGHFVNVSDAVRHAIRDFLKKEAKVLNITYNELIGVE